MFGDSAKFDSNDDLATRFSQRLQYRVMGSLSAALVLVTLSGCARPSEEECDAAAKKMASFFAGTDAAAPDEDNKAARELAEGMVEEIKADCLKQGTKREVECIMAAKTLEDMEACAK